MKPNPSVQVALACLGMVLYAGAAPAQTDLSGNWVLESDEGQPFEPFPDDFAGIPLNEQARLAGLAYSGDERQELYRQCEPWSIHYIVTGPWGGRFFAVRGHYGDVVAWTLSSPLYDRLPMTIWMDGRAPPSSLALHSYSGFTTGQWDGDTLVTLTTHLKDSFIERNGVPSSNQETLRLFFTRHGDELTVLGIMRDPVYLEAPWAMAKTWKLDTAGRANILPEYCQPAEIVSGLSDGRHIATELPGDIPRLQQYMPQHYDIPLNAAMGGAPTMYPEFSKKLQGRYKPPSTYCKAYCCEGGAGAPVCRTQ